MPPQNETLTPGAIWSSNRCPFFVTKPQLGTAPRVDGGLQELGVVVHACNPGTQGDFEVYASLGYVVRLSEAGRFRL